MQTPKTAGVHIANSLFALAFEVLAPDYLDRYQPARCRPVVDAEAELGTTQELVAVTQ